MNEYTAMHQMATHPMAMILPPDVFLIWCEIHYPNLPKVAEIKQLFQGMTPEQRNATVSRAKTLVKYGETLAEYGKAVASAGR